MMMHTRNGANSGGGQSSLGFLFGVDPPPSPPPPPPPKKPNMGSSSSLPMQIDHHIPQQHIQPSYVRLVPVPDKKLSVKKNNYAFDCGVSKNHLNGRSSSSGIKWTPKYCPDEKASDFLRHRPATKVHEVPGGPSSLGYIFGGK